MAWLLYHSNRGCADVTRTNGNKREEGTVTQSNIHCLGTVLQLVIPPLQTCSDPNHSTCTQATAEDGQALCAQ